MASLHQPMALDNKKINENIPFINKKFNLLQKNQTKQER